MLTITHTPADGTMLEGSTKGDGAWEAIRAAQGAYRIRGWKYFRSIRAIGVVSSRDRAPNLFNIRTTADVLRKAGFEVTVQVDTPPRPMAVAETDRAGRLEDRSEALSAKADRKSAEATAAHAASDQISSMIPCGQPILVGHHSERRHRRDLERMHNLDRKGWDAGREAEQAAHHAATSAAHMAQREDPGMVQRRLVRLRADLGRAQRSLDGSTRTLRRNDGSIYHQDITPPATGLAREQRLIDVAHLTEQITHWEAHLEQAKADGAFQPVDMSLVKPGDFIKGKFGLERVVKVHKATVTVERDPGWANKVKVVDITEHIPATVKVEPVTLP